MKYMSMTAIKTDKISKRLHTDGREGLFRESVICFILAILGSSVLFSTSASFNIESFHITYLSFFEKGKDREEDPFSFCIGK
jgi:hypothetical protein